MLITSDKTQRRVYFKAIRDVENVATTIRKYVDYLDEDRPLYRDNNRMLELLKTNEIIDAVEKALGKKLN